VCDELFKQIDTKKSSDTEHQVSVAMFEIYCERVRDLLSTAAPPKGGLKVREDPKKGFYGVCRVHGTHTRAFRL
jgi:hypothetical protein